MSNLPVFSLEKIWNESVSEIRDRELVPRDYIYASELGGALIDTILKMRGVPFSNTPNDRSMRKFFAGDVWEDVTKIVLASAGVLIRTQERLEHQYPTLCAVHGKLDHYAGGIPSATRVAQYFEGKKNLEEELFEDSETRETSLQKITTRIAEKLHAQFPDGFQKIVMEIKSTSTFMFAVRVKRNKPDIQHALQIYHYLKCKGEGVGVLEYVNRDDAMIKEFYIMAGDVELEAEYKKRIEAITRFYNSTDLPPKEPEIMFNEDLMKFEKNWRVEYSNYLTMLYGYSEPESYRERWDRTICGFNRVFKRAIQVGIGGTTPTGKPLTMTPANLEVIKEITAYFPNYEQLLVKAVELAKVDPTLALEETENE